MSDEKLNNKKVVDQKDKEEKPKKIDFVRKNPNPGVYSTNFLGKEIKLVDRDHFVTDDKQIIDFFKNDPEIVIFNDGKGKKK